MLFLLPTFSSFAGAVPQPRSLSVRIISAIWWVFSIVLLTAYIAGFSFVLESGSEQLSIQNFEDLLKQRQLEFGTMEGSSTLLYFKVCWPGPFCLSWTPELGGLLSHMQALCS